MSAIHQQQPLRILVIEDNVDIAENIGDYLEAQGHIMDFAMDGISGLHLAITQEYDVLILDIMLPGMDGITLCKKLREAGGKQIPVLMLTARDTLSNKLEGFKAGADDYLIKPFALQELEARIKALTKRAEIVEKPVQHVADLELDTGSMKVSRAGKPIDLNRACLKILQMLMQAYPNVVSRNEIEDTLWGDMPPGSDSLRSHIYILRRAIDKPFEQALLETVHGVGYRLVDPDEISV